MEETNKDLTEEEILSENDASDDSREEWPPNKKRKQKSSKRKFKCIICKKQCSDKSSLKQHIVTHSTATPFSCPLCPYSGKTKKYLARHHRNVHCDVRKSCEVCGGRFAPKSLPGHMRTHTGEKPFKCSLCGKAFNSTYSLQTHNYIHTDEKPFRCSFCEYACRDSSSLRKHQERHMGVEKIYQCNVCDLRVKSKPQLKMHISEVHLKLDVRRHQCDTCGGKFKDRARLNYHIEAVHKRSKSAECEVCGVRISNRANMTQHLLTHVRVRPYKCTFHGCRKRYKDHSALRKHNLTHYPDRQLGCSVCGKLFTRLSRLRSHETTQHRERRAADCPRCGLRFLDESRLKSHMTRRHSTRRERFECDTCGFVTYNKPSLVMHIRGRHISATLVRCKICSRQFKCEMNLLLHIARRHRKLRPSMPRPMKLPMPIKQEPKEEPLDAQEDEPSAQEEEPLDAQEDEPSAQQEEPLDAQEDEPSVLTAHNEDLYHDEKVSQHGSPAELRGDELAAEVPKNVFEKMIRCFRRKPGDGVRLGRPTPECVDLKKKRLARRCAERLLERVRGARGCNTSEKTEPSKNTNIEIGEIHRKDEARSHSIDKGGAGDEDLRVEGQGDQDVTDQDVTEERDVGDYKYSEREEDDDTRVNDDSDEEYVVNEREKKGQPAKGTVGGKLQLNTRQCYVCFKLFKTEAELLKHCTDHFDVCSTETLKKCPLCGFVTRLSIAGHLKVKHKLNAKVPYGKFYENENSSSGSKYYYNVKHKGIDRVEIIPSVRHLNKRASVQIDERNRAMKDKAVARKKLVKRGKEWVVENVKVDPEHFYIPEVNKELENAEYVDKMKVIYRVAKNNATRMLFPCKGCDKLCQTLSALTLHLRRHDINAKPFKKKVWKHKTKDIIVKRENKVQLDVNNRVAAPKPVRNKHKCDKELIEFYKNNIKGKDVEFWQFLKIYNKMGRERIEDFDDLIDRREFGVHAPMDALAQNDRVQSEGVNGEGEGEVKRSGGRVKVNRAKSEAFTRVVRLSKREHLSRIEERNKLRREIRTRSEREGER